MKAGWAMGLAISCVAAPAAAEMRPEPGPGDPRLQFVEYQPEQVTLIEAAPGFLVTVSLAADEKIQTIAVGDSGAWQVTSSRSGNQLFVKSLTGGSNTNMTVSTNVRSYAFDLFAVANPGMNLPYTIKFTYPSIARQQADQPKPDSPTWRYRLTGAKLLRPRAISDDGERTFVEWPANAPLPATFAVDKSGRESLTNGQMRGDIFVIDAVADRLIFRLDREVAAADRLRQGKER